MVNITHKNNTLRKAIAEAQLVVSSAKTIEAIVNKQIPKGDVFEFARAAGLLAVKKTADVIPDCHPLPVEFTAITYQVNNLTIHIYVEVHTIYKTGVEVEAMHGAAITALTMYDMLKPVDKQVVIGNIGLLEKKGGKSSFTTKNQGIKAAMIVCSDSVFAGTANDTAGKAVMEKLTDISFESYEVVPDVVENIQKAVLQQVNKNVPLIFCCGGTGLSKRDVTPEAVLPLIDTPIPGIMEAARQYGQNRTPYAMLSRGVAGFIQNSLVITLPGSVKGSIETVEAIFPHVLHVFNIRNGEKH